MINIVKRLKTPIPSITLSDLSKITFSLMQSIGLHQVKAALLLPPNWLWHARAETRTKHRMHAWNHTREVYVRAVTEINCGQYRAERVFWWSVETNPYGTVLIKLEQPSPLSIECYPAVTPKQRIHIPWHTIYLIHQSLSLFSVAHKIGTITKPIFDCNFRNLL